MKKERFLLATVAILGMASITSSAEFWDDFEAYADGSKLTGQGGWTNWYNNAGVSGVVSTKYAFSGTKSLEVLATTDQVHEFKLRGGRHVLTIQQYIPSGSTGTTVFALCSQYVAGSQEMCLTTNYVMDTGTISGQSRVKIVYDQWVEIKVLVDLVKNTVEEYYGGQLIRHSTWSPSNSPTFQNIDVWGTTATNSSPVYYDDLKIEPFYVYEASVPNPADGAIGVMAPALRWMAGDSAVLHDVYFSTSPELTAADKVSVHTPLAMYYHMPGLQPGTTYYWRVDEFEKSGTVHPGEVWSFTSMPLTTFGPGPADGTEGAPTVPVLTWSLPLSARESHVYFSDDIDAVKNGDASADKGVAAETTFNTGLLRAGTRYFWRVDVKNGAGDIVTGPIWSFTTINPVLGKVVREWWLNILGANVSDLTANPRYPANPTDRELVGLWEGPVDWEDYYGSRLYGWITPLKSGDYTFWIASDDASELWLSTDADPANGKLIAGVSGWVTSRDFENGTGAGGTNQKSAAVTLQAGNLYFMQALMKEGWSGDNIAVAWQPPGSGRDVIPGSVTRTFILPPLKAAAPSPSNGAIDVVQSPVLSWYAGENAQSHQVYFGDDAEAVAGADASSALYQGEQTGTTFEPGALDWGKAYFWRVDEITADSDQPLKGNVWSFTTADYIMVDDFESYTDEQDQGTRIFETWIDGLSDNSSGSVVGYAEAPFAERVRVWDGKQSMPFDYNNVNAPYFSEARRDYVAAQDWTANGMDTLVLHIRGSPANKATQPLYLALEDKAGKVGMVANADLAVLKAVDWVEWRIPLSQFGVNAAAVKKIIIGVSNKDNPTADGTGRIFIDAIRVIKGQ